MSTSTGADGWIDGRDRHLSGTLESVPRDLRSGDPRLFNQRCVALLDFGRISISRQVALSQVPTRPPKDWPALTMGAFEWFAVQVVLDASCAVASSTFAFRTCQSNRHEPMPGIPLFEGIVIGKENFPERVFILTINRFSSIQ